MRSQIALYFRLHSALYGILYKNDLCTVICVKSQNTLKWEVSGSTPCGVGRWWKVSCIGLFGSVGAINASPPEAADGTTFPATNHGSETRPGCRISIEGQPEKIFSEYS